MKRSPAKSQVTDRLIALSEVIRLRICRLLEWHELSVGEVSRVVQLPQSTVSRHLKMLTDAGWLAKRAEGTATFYRLILDELAPDSRALWLVIREQINEPAVVDEDDRRLGSVLAERRTDSLSFFGRVAGEWDSVRSELFGRDFTAGALLGLLPREWVVADVGCGTGNGAELLAPRVREVIAIDQSGPMLEAAAKRLSGHRNVRFAQGSIESLPLERAAVDACVCVLVLHHVAEPEDGLREMARITRPGGAVLVIDMYEHDHREFRRTMGHQHQGFSEKAVRAMFERAGLQGVTVTPLPGDPNAKGPGLFAAAGRVPGSSKTGENR